MENDENKNNIPQDDEEHIDKEEQINPTPEELKKQAVIEQINNTYNNPNNPYNPFIDPNVNRKKMSTLKIVGIVLLIVIGVPLVLFGACILMLNGGRL